MKPRTNSIVLKGDWTKNIRKTLSHTQHISSTYESKIHFWKITIVTGKVFSHLFCIISQFFCTFAKRDARDVLQKAILFLFFDLPRKGKRSETFYTRV
jgi:hypothetical protein